MDHDRAIAELISPFRQEQSSKGTCQENFTTVRGCFGLGTARVKALGALKKEENVDDESIFTVSRLTITISSNLLATVRWGIAR